MKERYIQLQVSNSCFRCNYRGKPDLFGIQCEIFKCEIDNNRPCDECVKASIKLKKKS